MREYTEQVEEQSAASVLKTLESHTAYLVRADAIDASRRTSSFKTSGVFNGDNGSSTEAHGEVPTNLSGH